ncbi:hypothetical protein LSTR_LSTR003570 [Laodelphax striatellus]|uniref:Uncharacterized protein n=1 Tax=Laodelphax striatellus TaxID=195883 RepID=A0A482WLG5_LAOST|nr:hypothetical protein LSTR_LSTR003570 [Laodelphax striatellus]
MTGRSMAMGYCEYFSENIELLQTPISCEHDHRAFARILCICCPRKIRRRRRAKMRARRCQYFGASTMVLAPASVTYATVSQHDVYAM